MYFYIKDPHTGRGNLYCAGNFSLLFVIEIALIHSHTCAPLELGVRGTAARIEKMDAPSPAIGEWNHCRSDDT